jgi:hypothetical protein
MLQSAPPPQQLPVLLLAAVHSIVLAEPDLELAAWYPSVTAEPCDGDPYPAFAALCRSRRHEIEHLLSTRHTQTNEVARCALFVPTLAAIEREMGPIALVDVGTSAGLNLLLDRYRYVYEPGGTVGAPSTVELTCEVRGDPPIPADLPTIEQRRGLDRCPVDARDAAQSRWLEACVWPDQTDRFERLRAALALAREIVPEVHTGDALTATAPLVASASAHPVVTNTWVLNYLSGPERRAYVEALDACGRERDLSWVFVESPVLVPELPGAEGRDTASALVLVRWRDGRRTVDHLARCHPHGYWMQWT